MIWLSGLGAFVTCSEFGYPHDLAVAFDAVCIVDEAIEDTQRPPAQSDGRVRCGEVPRWLGAAGSEYSLFTSQNE